MDPAWRDWLAARRADLVDRNLFRDLRPLEAADGTHAEIDGRPVVIFSSNDYLGLSFDRRVRDAAAGAAERYGMGPRGAALTCGYTREHEALEHRLADLAGKDAALLFPTGYAANLAVLTAFAGPGTAVFSDELNHASIVDGAQLAKRRGADVIVFRHGDPGHLDELLAASTAPRRLIVTDAVFSMDGDPAPLRDLVSVKRRHGAMLVVDEAHAMLVLGDRGGGLSDHLGVADEVDVHVGTLGKAIGSHGGFVAASETVREHLLNTGRSFIYSTALPRPVVAAAHAAVEVFRSEPEIRERLRGHIQSMTAATGAGSGSAIFKVVTGEEDRAVEAAGHLLERGFYVPAIRPPTVPPGTSRLRITLSAAHRPEEVAALVDALRELRVP